MEFNVIEKTKFSLEKRYHQLFLRVVDTVISLLHIEKEYVFSVIFVDDEMIHEINKSYRKMDQPTDVISFANLEDKNIYQDEDCELGDIFINTDAAQRQAKEYAHSFERELSFLFTHGLLHLLGYDHIQETDEKIMFCLQDEILNEIIIE